MSQAPTWRFRTMEEDQKHVEPTHREHLAPGGAVEPLVRESIQNSLDAPASVEGQPTKMIFTLGHVAPTEGEKFFRELRPHLEAITRCLPEGLPSPADPISFLAIEDSNTRGLEGEPSLRKPLLTDGSTKNHFFRFWHSVGQSAGDFKRRGSWGVGKVVFSNASRIRTFFGLTLRPGDISPLLMGEAGLTIHSLPGTAMPYDWYGYYADHQRRVPLPIQGSVASEFSRIFSLSRTVPGLSIVVPYVREDVKLNDLARIVIEQYFLPILAGRLEVIVRDSLRQIEISNSTIDDAVNQLTWPMKGPSSQSEIAALLRLARWQINRQPNEYVVLKPAGVDGAYSLAKDRFIEGDLLRVSDDFAAENRIALRIPILVRSNDGIGAEDVVRVVLERDESVRTSNIPHLRSGMNISKLRSQGPAGVRGLLVVGADQEQGPLDKLLQASEGPAHMNWELKGEGYDKAKSLYQDAYNVIHFTRNLVRNLVDLLAAPQDERDTRTLAAFFPDHSDAGKASGSGGGGKRGLGKKDPSAPPPLPPGVIEGVVTSFGVSLRVMRPIEAATVRVSVAGATEETIDLLTDANGRFRFEGVSVGNHEIKAHKDGVGVARKAVELPAETGVHVELVLFPEPTPKMFVKVRLEDGFAIRGNPEFPLPLRPVRVRLAYAAWGGSKSYSPADFSLNDSQMSVSFNGVQEMERTELIAAPNILRFKPLVRDFYVEVRGFDVNRALYADARTVEESDPEGGDE